MKRDWVMLFIGAMFASVMWPMAGWFSYSAVKQARTANWPAADEAEVQSSRVVGSSRRKGGTTYKPEVKYRYRVGDNWHIDDRISFSTGFGDSGGGYAQAVASAHPAGSKITVYVDPSDWTRSVLFRGMQERDWHRLAFVGPLATIPLVVCGVFIGSLVRASRGHSGSVRVFEPAPGVSVFRDIAVGPLGLGAGVLAGGTLLTAVVVMGFVYSGAREALLGGWGGSLLLGAAAWGARRYWIGSGRKDGVIDLNAGTLSLARGWRSEPEVLELERVTDVELRQDSSQSTDKRPHWRVHLRLDGEAETRPIADIRLKAAAREFENWVRERIALPVEPSLGKSRRKREKGGSDEGAE